MKDQFGREIAVGSTVIYSGVKSQLTFYEVSKVMGPKHKTTTGVTAKRYYFDAKLPDGFRLAERPAALVNDPSRYMVISPDALPIYHNKPV